VAAPPRIAPKERKNLEKKKTNNCSGCPILSIFSRRVVPSMGKKRKTVEPFKGEKGFQFLNGFIGERGFVNAKFTRGRRTPP